MLEEARSKRYKEMKMWDVMREITFYAFFLWIVMVISYSFREPEAYLIKRNVETMLVHQGLGHLEPPFTYTTNFLGVRI